MRQRSLIALIISRSTSRSHYPLVISIACPDSHPTCIYLVFPVILIACSMKISSLAGATPIDKSTGCTVLSVLL
uniref:Secreted protein n=1 Tax=Heterorhabditis bacteriophora TaxID=37862 RepID=A0A1I7XEL9_HETBA